jgi:hypothetical protein
VFEVYLLLACALIGVSGLITPHARARSVVAAFPDGTQTVWYVGIALGAALAIYGIARGEIEGLLKERAALIVMSGLSASYAVASVAYGGWPALSGAFLLISFAVACAVRSCQLTADLTAVRTELRRLADQ